MNMNVYFQYAQGKTVNSSNTYNMYRWPCPKQRQPPKRHRLHILESDFYCFGYHIIYIYIENIGTQCLHMCVYIRFIRKNIGRQTATRIHVQKA